MKDGLNFVSGLLLGGGGAGAVWLALGPVRCEESGAFQNSPELAAGLGEDCTRESFLGWSPLIEHQTQAVFLALLFGGICWFVAYEVLKD